jgi:hypothetical protein
MVPKRCVIPLLTPALVTDTIPVRILNTKAPALISTVVQKEVGSTILGLPGTEDGPEIKTLEVFIDGKPFDNIKGNRSLWCVDAEVGSVCEGPPDDDGTR